MHVIPLFNRNAQDVIDARLLEPLNGQGSREVGQQHVLGVELAKDFFRDEGFFLPFHGMLMKVFPQKGATFLLELVVGWFVVW